MITLLIRYINKKHSPNTDEGIEERDKMLEYHQIALALIVFNEFIKELSAITQEHFILNENQI
jgi:hypothetical protein